jgi:hypothetical protein
MPASNTNTKKNIGFSTGAIELRDYKAAIQWSLQNKLRTIELSALRFEELEPLVGSLESFDWSQFDYVSLHAPSSFPKDKEDDVLSLLKKIQTRKWNIIVHPDILYTPSKWRHFGRNLLIENMDRRKPIGRTLEELTPLFADLPEARMCLDLAHARQLDTTMTLLWSFFVAFHERIAEIHISELDSRCKHHPLSVSSVRDYKNFSRAFSTLPIIIESVLPEKQQRIPEYKIALEVANP